MKINVDLNAKSIQNAINALKTAQKQLGGEMLNEFLIEACKWVKERANGYLALSTVGSGVKAEIENSWVIGAPADGKITMTNTADKAVYVEFGVGVIGEQNKHKNADETGYEYNVPSKYKSELGSWTFKTELGLDEVDIPQENIDDAWTTKSNKHVIISTRGAKGAMYAYNAIVDFRDYGAKEVWQKIKVKYWG